MKTIYSVVQADYEAPTTHGEFFDYDEAHITKEKLKALWEEWKKGDATINLVEASDEEFVEWNDFMEKKYGNLRFFSFSLDDFFIAETKVYESAEEFFNEIHPTKHV